MTCSFISSGLSFLFERFLHVFLKIFLLSGGGIFPLPFGEGGVDSDSGVLKNLYLEARK